MKHTPILATAILTLTALTATPAHADTLSCTTKRNAAQGRLTIDRGHGGGPDITGYGEWVTGYVSCRRDPGKDYIRVTWGRGNFYPSSHVDCDSWDSRRVTGVKFRPYMWGGQRNFRRPEVLAKCRNSGVWTTGVRYYDGIVVYPTDGSAKFRAAMTGVVEGWPDTDGSTKVGRLTP